MARQVVTDTNSAPVVEIFIWLCLVFVILTVITRLGIKLRVVRKTGLDDVVIAISVISAGAQSIAVSVATANGLGVSIDQLTSSELSAQLKASYAANFLFILSCYFAKISFILFIRALTPATRYRQLGQYLGLIISLWMISALLANAFQCQLPKPWNVLGGKCFNLAAFENYVAVLNALTDLALIILPFAVVSSIQISTKRKIAVLFAFSLRLSVVAAIICQIIFLNINRSSNDFSLAQSSITISVQLAQCLSICTTCALYLKPFLDSLESGFIHIGDLRRQNTEGFGYSPKASKLLSPLWSISGRLRKPNSQIQNITLQERTPSTVEELQNLNRPKMASGQRSADFDERNAHDADGQAQIPHTREWTVEYDGSRPHASSF